MAVRFVVSKDGSTLVFRALPYSSSELEAAMYTCDLPDRSQCNGQHAIHVTVDHAWMGLGGDTSWCPGVYDEFLVKPYPDYHSHLWLLPLRQEDDVSLMVRDVCLDPYHLIRAPGPQVSEP